MTTGACESCRALAPELALGVASGDQRAAALRHLATCPACREDVRELTETAETLLLAVREVEPSAGFEQRVVDALHTPDRRWSRRSVIVACAAAVVVALALGAVAGWVAARPGPAAQDYAAAVEGTAGSSLRVEDLGLADEASRVVVYDGEPSWLLVSVFGGLPDGEYRIVCEYEGGWSIEPGSVTVEDGRGTWATTVPRRLDDLTGVWLRASDGTEAGNAQFG